MTDLLNREIEMTEEHPPNSFDDFWEQNKSMFPKIIKVDAREAWIASKKVHEAPLLKRIEELERALKVEADVGKQAREHIEDEPDDLDEIWGGDDMMGASG